jgi:hypothetical protein
VASAAPGWAGSAVKRAVVRAVLEVRGPAALVSAAQVRAAQVQAAPVSGA